MSGIVVDANRINNAGALEAGSAFFPRIFETWDLERLSSQPRAAGNLLFSEAVLIGKPGAHGEWYDV